MTEVTTSAQALEEKYDPEMRFRPIRANAALIVTGLLIVLSCFHYYTAGFGLLRETTHRGVHLAFVLGLVFLVFPLRKAMLEHPHQPSAAAPGGVPLYDWMFAAAIAASVLYVPYIFDDLAFRVGNPSMLDTAMGTILVVLLLDATRRAMGWPLPIIAMAFIVYALAGSWFPGLLKHSGASWSALVNHLYLTSQGIYGIAVGVVATYVFHFVLFGVLATAIGLGQLFIDIASSIAGRYAGGPAKVSVFASALFGMLSGSSVANAVTVGSLTIPAMIRLGYPRHFAGGVEAASSTGGQITPPIMGAAAFLMIEFLNLPYSTIVIAAIVPAFMHFFGVFMQVHFEAKNKGLRGLTKEELPNIRADARRQLADAHSLGPARRHHRQRQHAVPRRVHRHQLVHPRRALHVAQGHHTRAIRGADRVARGADRDHHAAPRRLRAVGVPRDAGRRAARASGARESVAHRRPRRSWRRSRSAPNTRSPSARRRRRSAS